MNDLYNSQFEIELRILLLLSSASKEWLSKGELFAYDFIISYGKEFEIGETNLHGDSSFKFGEITLRKNVIDDAIKDLVVRSYIEVNADSKDGFLYRISSKGLSYICSFENDYSEMYKEIADSAFKKYKNSKENELENMIHDKSMNKRS